VKIVFIRVFSYVFGGETIRRRACRAALQAAASPQNYLK
jgi:hypothetical protein